MKEIQLTNGGITLVSDEDYEWLNSYKWYKWMNQGGDWYVLMVNVYTRMHRMIMNAPPKMKVDHINFNTLDNQRGNLRVVTHSQNMQHRRGASSNSKTGIRGVRPYKRGGFVAVVTVNTVRYEKHFKDVHEASKWVEEERDRRMTHHV